MIVYNVIYDVSFRIVKVTMWSKEVMKVHVQDLARDAPDLVLGSLLMFELVFLSVCTDMYFS